MSKISLDIKNIIHVNLLESRKDKIQMYYKKLNNMQGKEYIHEYIKINNRLINEGYTMDEINEVTIDPKLSLDKLKNMDLSQIATSSFMDTIKEMCVYWILTIIFPKMDKSLAKNISRFWTNVGLLDILRPFKNKDYCLKYGPNLLDGLLEVMIRYSAEKITGVNSENQSWFDIGNVFLGNLAGTIVKETDTSEMLSKKICPLIHD